ncbi:hypothetical protein ACIBI9_30310 [Nonomuraea sp. NPDC050451]|uniref:hypothetical protein n=1 Tax=Nonomuraea sp. NPDC050451 TaxID=3364364 RepID=UPI0037A6FCEF
MLIDPYPDLALGVRPRAGDRFYGSIPQEICRQVAYAYMAAGHAERADEWLAYGATITAEGSVRLAKASTGRHAANRVYRHLRAGDDATIRDLYLSVAHTSSGVGMALHAPATEPTPEIQHPAPGEARFTTREAKLLQHMLATASG